MEEVRVYHSFWRMLPMVVVCGIAVAIAILMLCDPMANHLVAWFSLVFFGFCVLIFLYIMFKEKLTKQPFLTITDKSIIIRGMKTWEAIFADVESFKLFTSSVITIHYKPGVEQRKMEEASLAGRALRKFNKIFSNAQESISTTGLSMNAEALYQLLNERLK